MKLYSSRFLVLPLLFIALLSSCSKDETSNQDNSSQALPGKLIFDKGSLLKYELLKLDDGNVLISATQSTTGRNLDLMKYSPLGEEIWSKSISHTSVHYRHTSMLTYLDEIYIAAHTFNSQSGTRGDVALIKLSANGDMIWENFYQLPDDQQIEDLTLSHDNKLLIVGRHDSANSIGNADLFLQKFDLDGNSLWTSYHDLNGIQLPNKVVAAKNGGFITLGSSNAIGYSQEFAFYLSKYSATGGFLWEKRQSYGSEIRAGRLKRLAEGDYITWGAKGNVNPKGLILKIDQDGEIIWNKTYSLLEDYTSFNNLIENADGSFSVFGHNTKRLANNEILWSYQFAKVAQNGDLLSWKEIPGMVGVNGTQIVQDQNGDFIMVNKLDGKLYFARMSKEGNPIAL